MDLLDASIRIDAYIRRELDYRRDFEEHEFIRPESIDEFIPVILTNSTYYRDIPLKAVRGAFVGAGLGGIVGAVSGEANLWMYTGVLGAGIDAISYTVRGHYHNLPVRAKTHEPTRSTISSGPSSN